MALKLITAPSTQPVTLAEAKVHLRVDNTDEDALIGALVDAATSAAEHATGRALMAQTWEVTFDAFPDAVELTRTPVQSITSITYADETGAPTVLNSSLYALDAADEFGHAYAVPVYDGAWPSTRDEINAVKVRYVAGYATVPPGIKQWILLQVGTMYANRESVNVGNITTDFKFVDALLYRYKVYG